MKNRVTEPFAFLQANGKEGSMTRALRAACVIVVLACAQSAVAEPSLKDLAARTELRAIETLTLTDQQFLTGDKNGKAVTIAGELRIPQGASGRLPAVILEHGSAGPTGGAELWAKNFNEMGIASFLVDSFSGRGIVSTSADQALLGRLNMVLDGYRAFEVLANHPRIDPARIAVMGFSRGGQAALYASLKRFHQSWNKSGAEFAAYIPFYPDCMTTFVSSDTEVTDRPIRIFHGAADDYNPAAPCKAYAERLRGAGRDVQLTEYPDAHHLYDNPLGNKTPTVAKGAQSVRSCKLKEEPLGTIINAETGQPFTYQDPCVQIDPHMGYNEAAANATRVAVKDFVRTVFKLE
jgi:dienelactone hydrolase